MKNSETPRFSRLAYLVGSRDAPLLDVSNTISRPLRVLVIPWRFKSLYNFAKEAEYLNKLMNLSNLRQREDPTLFLDYLFMIDIKITALENYNN